MDEISIAFYFKTIEEASDFMKKLAETVPNTTPAPAVDTKYQCPICKTPAQLITWIDRKTQQKRSAHKCTKCNQWLQLIEGI